MSLSSSFLRSDSESDVLLESATRPTRSEPNEGYAYRVRVCLRKYFRDERGRSYVLVSGRRRVSWLECRLRHLFGLRGPFCLTSKGHLLPSAELLAILRPDDLVDVIPTAKDACQDMQDCNFGLVELKNSPAKTCDNENHLKNDPRDSTNVGSAENAEMNQSFLENYKKQALALLERNYLETNQDNENNENSLNNTADLELQPRKRRRVRNRKNARKSDNKCNGLNGASSETESTGVEAVQRNRAASQRAPRLVHAARLPQAVSASPQ